MYNFMILPFIAEYLIDKFIFFISSGGRMFCVHKELQTISNSAMKEGTSVIILRAWVGFPLAAIAFRSTAGDLQRTWQTFPETDLENGQIV
jgi:hypothetical protein